jgi:NodT family efflux transporter outer membrane factor (OMF) lipoprotein
LPETFSVEGVAELQTQWWLTFHDDPLTKLIEQALGDNFNLRVVAEKLEETKALARQAGAPLVPTLDGRGSVSSSRNHSTDDSTDNFLLGLAASYEVDFWGRLRARSDAALLDVGASLEDYHTAALSLAAEVAITWYQFVESNLQLRLLNSQKETNTQVLELISMQFRSGQAGIADVLQQRQLVESNISDMAALRANIYVLKHRMAILLGALPGKHDLPSPERLPDPAPLPSTGIPLDLLARRPDIRASYLKLKADDHRVAAAVANRLPRLTISADLTTAGQSGGDLFNTWISSLAAGLFGPIIDGGLRKAEVARSQSVAEQQFYRHCQAILEAIGEVEDALVQEKEQLIILASQKNQLQLAAETIEHVANRYRQGVEDYQRVLLALLSHQSLQRSLLTSQRRLLNIRIALYRALSGQIPLANATVGEKRLPLDTQQAE